MVIYLQRLKEFLIWGEAFPDIGYRVSRQLDCNGICISLYRIPTYNHFTVQTKVSIGLEFRGLGIGVMGDGLPANNSALWNIHNYYSHFPRYLLLNTNSFKGQSLYGQNCVWKAVKAEQRLSRHGQKASKLEFSGISKAFKGTYFCLEHSASLPPNYLRIRPLPVRLLFEF